MTSSALEHFISAAAERSRSKDAPADCVLALAPLMFGLLERAETFLEPRHYRSDPGGYIRNLVYEAPDECMSLYAIVAHNKS